MIFQTSLGIEIRREAVSLVYLTGSFKGPCLKASNTYPVPESNSDEKRMELITGIVKDFIHDNKISPATVFLSVSRELTVLRYLELPSAVKENLKESLGYQMDKYVPFPVEDLYYDCQIVGENEADGHIRVLLVAAKRGLIDPYISLANNLNLGLSGLEVNSTARANYVLTQLEVEDNGPTALIYMSDGAVEIDLLKSGILDHSRFVSGEGQQTNVMELIDTELKKVAQRCGPIDGRLETFILGPTSDIQRIMDRMGDSDEFEFHAVDHAGEGLPSSDGVPAYALALQGIVKLPMKINLIPEGLRKGPNKIGLYTMFVLAALLVLSLLTWSGGKIATQQFYLNRLNAEINELSVKVAEINQIRDRLEEVEARIDFLNEFYSEDVSVLEVLKELSARIPKSAWVRSLTFSDGELRIDGLASSSSELVPLLDESDIFEDVGFVSSITRSRQGTERFRIKLKLTK